MPISKLSRVAPAVAPTKPCDGRFALAAIAAAFLFLVASVSASAQVKQLFKHDDIAISGAGVFTTSVTGVPPNSVPPVNLTEKASNSADLIFSFRYTHSHFFGLEANYAYTRFTEDFTIPNPQGGTPPTVVYPKLVGGTQNNVQEFSGGYMLHGPNLLGLLPFAGAGIGIMEFKPTFQGGQAIPTQARMLYYGTVGVDAPLVTNRFGVRAQVRDLFYRAPDFGQNYLTTGKHTQSLEPTIGVYLHF